MERWLGLVGRVLSRASGRALGRAGRPQQQPNGWRALAAAADPPPAVTGAGCTFENDLRATSGLGSGDGLTTHTDKWLSVRFPPRPPAPPTLFPFAAGT